MVTRPGDAAVFVHDDGHANIVLLHLAQQIADQLALGDKIDIAAHDGVHRAHVGFGVRNLQHVLGKHNAHDVMNGAFENRHPGKRLGAQQFDELLDGGVGSDGHNFRPRFHGFADGFLAELHHRLDQVAIAFIQDAFLLARFDERVHRFRLGLGRLVRMFLGKRRDRLQEPDHQGDRQHDVDQYSQQDGATGQPFAPRP